jgi:hypothetical protein
MIESLWTSSRGCFSPALVQQDLIKVIENLKQQLFQRHKNNKRDKTYGDKI